MWIFKTSVETKTILVRHLATYLNQIAAVEYLNLSSGFWCGLIVVEVLDVLMGHKPMFFPGQCLRGDCRGAEAG